ncbi:MAPEG family protein [Lutimaribacter marinistellae]|uniref:MAPEG family protein n=1 Tax=Lutimaribacter marinistellae TaxID=1820329 RepID=A0ABV7TI06_9RHOB
MLSISPLYAALIALLFIFLSADVIRHRGRARVSSGDGGDADLQRAIRTHANCAEYAPIGLLLLVTAELAGTPVWALHGLGLAILAGRVMHAIGFGRAQPVMLLRQLGMVLTFTAIILGALANLLALI